MSQSHLGITRYVLSRFQIGQSYLSTSWYVSAISHLVSNFQVPAGTPLPYPKSVSFIQVLIDAFLLSTRCYVFTTSQRGQSHSRTSHEVIKTSQVGQFHLRTSCDVFAKSQVRQSHLGNSWYVAMTSQIGRFYLGASETS